MYGTYATVKRVFINSRHFWTGAVRPKSARAHNIKNTHMHNNLIKNMIALDSKRYPLHIASYSFDTVISEFRL